ncbi:MAG TPA: pitrilysin family protein [Pyrinomonadaceae bacterium]|nr:pitrilysin family protein [Pyrinomonadaceae bacterium]
MTKAIRTTAPEALAPVPFNIPKAFETTLDNGLKVILFEEKRLPLVSFRLAFLSGDIHDPAGSTGLTSAIASMLTEGTLNYTSRALAEKIERLGGSLSASSSDDFTLVAASALSFYRSEVLQLIAEVVFRPTFPEEELDLYRRNTIENLKFQRSQPGFLANEQSSRLIYGAHPYSKVSPTAADIEKLNRSELRAYHEKVFVPNNAILIVVGDLDREDFLKELNDEFRHWKAGETATPKFPAPPKRSVRTITIVDRPGSAQANIVLGNLAIDRRDRDYFPMIVMNQILGAGASSRVFMNLREEKGYTYGAYTRIDAKRLTGDFTATAEVRTSVTGDSLKEFYYELERIRTEKASENELADAKNFLTGVFPIRAETQEGLTGLIVNQQLYGLPEDYLQTYRDNVDAVTLDDVLEVARKYVLPDAMAIVVVGDASEVLPQIREYAQEIEVFDTEAKALDVAKYEQTGDAVTADASGKWAISLEFQGQKVPVTLTMTQVGETVSGTLETMLGNGTIGQGKMSGRKLNATSQMEIQGQKVEFNIAGTIDGNSIAGEIIAPIVPAPLSFSGSRED